MGSMESLVEEGGDRWMSIWRWGVELQIVKQRQLPTGDAQKNAVNKMKSLKG